jgi:tetratricopeptide (TPR) repeat protein
MFPRLHVLPLLVLLASGCNKEEAAQVEEMPAKEHAEGLYIQGTSQYLQGKFDEALLSFSEMRKLAPTDPRLPAAVGEVYLSQGKLPEATKEFEAALKLDPKRSTNWSRLGFIHAQLGKREEAIAELRKAVELNPRDFNALEQLGEIHLKDKQVDEAVRDFTLAAEVAPDSLKAGLLQRAVDTLLQQGRHGDLLPLLQKATTQGIRTPEILTALGDEQVRAGQLTEALATYREAAGKAPKDPTLWELVAELHQRLGQPDEAVAAYGESLKVKDRAIVHVALARLALARKDAPAAQKELELALGSVSGSDVRELSEVATLLSELDRKPDALRILASLAGEPDQQKDVELQLRTARLARELKDAQVMKEACDRVIAATTPAPEAPAAPTAPTGKAGEKGKTVKARGAPGPAVKCP